MGPPEESTCHELWQAEPVDTSVLQEGDHSQARCVSETGLPVRAPSVRQWNVGWCAMRLERATGRANYPDVMHCEAWHDNLSCNTCTDQPHWYTFLLPVKGKLRGTFCACEKETRQCYRWGFLLQNKTTIYNKDKCTVFTFAWSASTFLFPSHVIFKYSSLPELTAFTQRFPRKCSFRVHLFT